MNSNIHVKKKKKKKKVVFTTRLERVCGIMEVKKEGHVELSSTLVELLVAQRLKVVARSRFLRNAGNRALLLVCSMIRLQSVGFPQATVFFL
ncbi:hypothetical protein MKW98_028422 [Papaver atlanticum]|uniref:Uncharacterized protein n=1 Tax=Papaver atlanticum TaxID=357466 RepID=A0AAD4SY98_9MAGN|nr:hypothetical protein MKW98_028422 [Papaver atlanticum]